MKKSNSNNLFWFKVLLICAGIFIFYIAKASIINFVLVIGFNSLFFLDNLFEIGPFNNIVVWGIWGLLIGGIIGVLIAIKKHKLSYILLLYPFLLISILATIMSFINKPTNYTGDYIFPESTPESNASKNDSYSSNFYMTNTDANVRFGPGTQYKKLFVIQKGFEVEVIQSGFIDDKGKEWYKIKFLNGNTGFMSAKILEPSQN